MFGRTRIRYENSETKTDMRQNDAERINFSLFCNSISFQIVIEEFRHVCKTSLFCNSISFHIVIEEFRHVCKTSFTITECDGSSVHKVSARQYFL